MADKDDLINMLARTRIPFSIREYPEDWVTRSQVCVGSVVGHRTQFCFDSQGYLLDIAWIPDEHMSPCKVEHKYN